MLRYRGVFGWVPPQALETNWVGRVKSKVLKILGEWSPLYDLLNHIRLFIPCFVVIKDWSLSAPYSYLGCGMRYQDGKLTVPTPGQYYIYAQLLIGGMLCKLLNGLPWVIVLFFLNKGVYLCIYLWKLLITIKLAIYEMSLENDHWWRMITEQSLH